MPAEKKKPFEDEEPLYDEYEEDYDEEEDW